MTTAPLSDFEINCPGGLEWAYDSLGECVKSVRDKVSIAFGILSIVCWFLFAIPQIVENCRSKIPDAAVSIFLLLFWLLGDTLNFIGGFLTDQLFLQKLLAGYTVVVDIILWIQYLYYRHRNKRMRGVDRWDDESVMKTDAEIGESSSSKGKGMASVLLGVMAFSCAPASMMAQTGSLGLKQPFSRHLLQAATTTNAWDNFIPTAVEKVGYTLGWMSAIMYISGRFHQIYMNWRRHCTEGLSFYLFFLAVLGNVFYGCQIFIKSVDAVFIMNSLPWILGSLGVVLLDAFILVQFFMYRNNHEDRQEGGAGDEFDGASV